jgi:type IV pilus assembly protein PilE
MANKSMSMFDFQGLRLKKTKKVCTRCSGFTLIELMIVVAIMAILTMVAYPSYQESMRKSRRSDAVAAVLAIQAAEEKFRANCPLYAEAFVTAADGNDCDAGEIVASSTSPDAYYSMAVSGATGNAYIITATAQGAQTADTACDEMTITFDADNPNGVKAPADCWP